MSLTGTPLQNKKKKEERFFSYDLTSFSHDPLKTGKKSSNFGVLVMGSLP